MDVELIIMKSRIKLIQAEHEFTRGRQGNADKHLYEIYNMIHFGNTILTAEQRKHRPPGGR